MKHEDFRSFKTHQGRVMDQIEYDRWWPLHQKASRGEQLPDADRQLYEDGLRKLHLTENSPGDQAAAEAARMTIAELRRQRDLLRASRVELESELAATEAALSEYTRELLGMKE